VTAALERNAADSLQWLRARAATAAHSSGQVMVAEPYVKEWLTAFGIRSPRGLSVPVAATGDGLLAAIRSTGLNEPLVLKAWGGGLVHKTDIGAVRLGLTVADLAAAVDGMLARLDAVGVTPDGFLVEEQQPGGVELIVGGLQHYAVGPMLLFGVGGTLTEVVDDSVVRLVPVTRREVEAMLDGFSGAALLDGARGSAPLDREALVRLLLAIGGHEGVLASLGSALAEFECNPVVATADGTTALDARLLLRESPQPVSPRVLATDFAPLFAPRSVAVAGASTSHSGFGNRFLAAYRAAGWTENLFAIHPKAAQIDGVPAVPSVRDIPGGVDYLLAAVPAAACADLVRDNSRQVRFVHVISGGFGETGPAGAALETDLVAAAAGANVRMLGPNCMGVYSPQGRQTFQVGAAMVPGTVSVLSQSGGLTGDIVQAGQRIGLRFARVASMGNAADVTPGELLDWLVDDPETKVLGLYLEGLRGGDRLVAALRRLAGRKPVVLLVGGQSDQGSGAVASHTGAMATEPRVWQALAVAGGATVVNTLEDLVGALLHLQRWAALVPDEPIGPDVLIVGAGGGASVLATDACDRAGLNLAWVPPAVQAELRGRGYGAGTSIANPIEIPIGPAASLDAFSDVLTPILTVGRVSDLLLHVNVAAYYGYGPGDVSPLVELVHRIGQTDVGTSRVALVLRNLGVARGADADRVTDACNAARLPWLSTFDSAAVAISAAQTFAELARQRNALPARTGE
jgi:acyl-CoA synthetase (NDP forming)